MVMRLAWMAHRLVSSSRCTMKSSEASCSASNASAVQRKKLGLVMMLEISRTCGGAREVGGMDRQEPSPMLEPNRP